MNLSAYFFLIKKQSHLVPPRLVELFYYFKYFACFSISCTISNNRVHIEGFIDADDRGREQEIC